jgi:uncharacterized SAM-binding protein YcdF (DUF218 family)
MPVPQPDPAPQRRRHRRRRFWLPLLALASLPLALLLWLGLAALPSSSQADCIVVPGAAVRANRQPSDALRYRLEAALDLFEAGRAPWIVVTGGGEGNYAEAEVMAEWLLERGVPPDAVIVEDRAANTRESGRHVAHQMRERGLRSALIVTQWFHVARTRLCLEQEGVRTYAAPCGGNVLRREPLFIGREMLGLPAYALKLDTLRE